MDILLYTILAITFIEVKILLYLSVRILMEYKKPVEFTIPTESNKEDLRMENPMSYNDILAKANRII